MYYSGSIQCNRAYVNTEKVVLVCTCTECDGGIKIIIFSSFCDGRECNRCHRA